MIAFFFLFSLYLFFTWEYPAFWRRDQGSKAMTVWIIPASSKLTKFLWSVKGDENSDNNGDKNSESITTTVLWLNFTSFKKWNIFSFNISGGSSELCSTLFVWNATFPSNNRPWLLLWQVGWRDRRSEITPLRNGV